MKPLSLVCLSNEFTVAEDGWVRMAPYGDSIKKRWVRNPAGGPPIEERFKQRLTRQAAEEMASKANSIWGKIKRFKVGIPIYRNHPDLAKHSPDVITHGGGSTQELGTFAEIAARDDGLYGRPVLHEAGRAAVENDGLKYFSPFWWVRELGQEEDGARLVEPHELISAGLTDRPNIHGGDAMANTDDTMDRTALIKLLGLAADATDDQITAAITALMAKAKDAETVTAERDGLANEKAALTADRDSERVRATTLAQALANERTRADGLLLDTATAEGRVSAATRPQWETALANEATRAAKLTELAAVKPALKTKSEISDVGQRKQTAQSAVEASSQVLALANERINTFPGSYEERFNAAYADVKRTHPQLFESMKQPAAA